jgi:hypothetical protein
MRGTWFLSSGWGKIVTGVVTVGAMVMGACSASTDNTFGTGSGGRGGTGTGNSGNGNGEGGDAGGFIPGTGGGSSVSGGSCAATVNKAQQVPLGMYLMMDRSGSMQGSPWTSVTNAIKAFVDQPSTAGIGVGLEFFPAGACPDTCNTNTDCGPCAPCVKPVPFFPGFCNGSASNACDVNEYATPAVAIANLPGIAPVIKSSINSTSPSGGTPTSAALDGAIQYTKQWMSMNPNAVGVTIFATDGAPSDCDTNEQNIYNIAAAGLAGTPSVRTYVIGVGMLPFLNDLAVAGGTGAPFFVDTNANAQQDFLNAMNSIRGAALSCAYLIPPAPAGEMIDYNAINVQYTPTGGMPILIPKAQSQAACPASGMAWYYDNNSPPQQILLCPATCSQISADTSGQVDVLVGCATVIN